MIKEECVGLVDSFKVLAIVISSDLSWANNCISIVKKGQMHLHFLGQLKKFGLNETIVMRFYCSVIDSMLCCGITVWFGGTVSNERAQPREVCFLYCRSRIIQRQLGATQGQYIQW